MATLEEKQDRVIEATESGFRGSLLARGQARSMIWRGGVLPDDAPAFSPLLSYDLLSYAYALISDGLEIIEEEGDTEIARRAFENGASALESVIAKGAEDPSRDFHRFVAAAAYHLARFSARAYSILVGRQSEPNMTEAETCLTQLMLRDLDGLEETISTFEASNAATDDALVEKLSEIDGFNESGEGKDPGSADDVILDVVDTALTDSFMSAFAMARTWRRRASR